jgi:hypothetical protein
VKSLQSCDLANPNIQRQSQGTDLNFAMTGDCTPPDKQDLLVQIMLDPSIIAL